jgi:ribonuclease HI
MKKGKRFTTINTDAGIKGDISAYGYWIRSEHIKIFRTGKFQQPKTGSTDAELACLLIAMIIVARDEYLRSADIIVVNSDSKGALQILRNSRIDPISPYFKAWQEIRQTLKKPIYYKWVKGHSKGNTPREWVNNHIDKKIREHYKPTNK